MSSGAGTDESCGTATNNKGLRNPIKNKKYGAVPNEKTVRRRTLENEKNNLQLEKEQIMKYQGKTIHKNKYAETWYTRIRLDGKQVYISAKTQKDCYNKLKQAVKHANLGILSTPAREMTSKSITLQEWYEKWLRLYKIGKVKESTIKDYNSSLKNISKNILKTPIKEIELSEILNNLNQIKAERQKQKVHELLKMLYQKAKDNEIIDKNIINRIDRPEHVKENSQPLTKEKEQQLIEICKNIENGDIYLVTLYQGLRKGEVLGLTIDNIDFENKTITINKTLNKENKFDTTKNKQSIRTTPLFDSTLEILNKYKHKTNRIFDITTKQLDTTTKKLKELTKSDFKIKDLRSTFITRCKENQIPEFVIQSWVGHKIGSRITSQVYTKYNAEDNKQFIDLINNSKLNSNSTQKKK